MKGGGRKGDEMIEIRRAKLARARLCGLGGSGGDGGAGAGRRQGRGFEHAADRVGHLLELKEASLFLNSLICYGGLELIVETLIWQEECCKLNNYYSLN